MQEYAAEVRAARRVTDPVAPCATPNGILKEFYPFGAQIGQPEDYHGRGPRRSSTRFVAAAGDLEIDPQARVEAETNEDGRFEINVVSGRSVLFFGEGREDGTLDFEIPNKDANLGDLTIPPRQMAKPPVPGPVHGLVLNIAGRPHAGAEVRLWAGVVGAPSHVGRTNADGKFRFERIRSEQAILWAVLDQPPARARARPELGNRAPAVQHAGGPARARPGRVLLDEAGGGALRVLPVRARGRLPERRQPRFASDEVGLPVGRYHIAVVTHDHRILERQLAIRKGGKGVLRPRDFTDTTWHQ